MKKSIILILIMFLLFTGFLFAVGDGDILKMFDEAKKAYQDKDYKKAISKIDELREKIVEEQYNNSAKISFDGDISVGMATDIGGVNDQSFNTMAWFGLLRAQYELGVVAHYVESTSDDDYDRNLESLASEGYDMIWGVGFLMADAIKKAALENPSTYFGIVDSDIGGKPPKNVVCVAFKEHEGSFLVGVIAGLMTKTNKIAFIGGIKFSLIEKFMYGYKAGIKYVNPKAEITDVWAESFTDASIGKSLANQLYGAGCDVIYHAAGNVGKGLFESAIENNKWAIGVDSDQSKFAPNNILTSMLKRVDNAVYKIVKDYTNNITYGGTIVEFGVKEEGVDFVKSKHIPNSVLNKVEDIKKKIINGEIVVPYNKSTYTDF